MEVSSRQSEKGERKWKEKPGKFDIFTGIAEIHARYYRGMEK